MNFKTLALFFWVFLIAGAAIAGEEHRTRIEIAVDDDATGGQYGDVQYIDGSEFDSDTDLHAHGMHDVRIIRKEVDETNQIPLMLFVS